MRTLGLPFCPWTVGLSFEEEAHTTVSICSSSPVSTLSAQLGAQEVDPCTQQWAPCPLPSFLLAQQWGPQGSPRDSCLQGFLRPQLPPQHPHCLPFQHPLPLPLQPQRFNCSQCWGILYWVLRVPYTLHWPLDSTLIKSPTSSVPSVSRQDPASCRHLWREAAASPINRFDICLPGKAPYYQAQRGDPPRSHSRRRTKAGAATSSLLLGFNASCSNFISSFHVFQVTVFLSYC